MAVLLSCKICLTCQLCLRRPSAAQCGASRTKDQIHPAQPQSINYTGRTRTALGHHNLHQCTAGTGPCASLIAKRPHAPTLAAQRSAVWCIEDESSPLSTHCTAEHIGVCAQGLCSKIRGKWVNGQAAPLGLRRTGPDQLLHLSCAFRSMVSGLPRPHGPGNQRGRCCGHHHCCGPV